MTPTPSLPSEDAGRTITVPEKALRAELEKLIQERDRLTARVQEAKRERDEARENGEGFRSSMYALEERVAALREALENIANRRLTATDSDIARAALEKT